MKILLTLSFIALCGAFVANQALVCKDDGETRVNQTVPTLSHDTACREDPQRRVIPGRL